MLSSQCVAQHTEQRAQRFLLQKLDFHISLWRNCGLLARSLGTVLVSLSLLLGHGVDCLLHLAIGVGGVAIKKVQPQLAEMLT